MIDSAEGLNDREGILNELRAFFRYEEELLKGWYSKSDFEETIIQLAKELIEQTNQNE